MEAQGRGEGQEDQQNPRRVKPPDAQMSRHQPPPLQRCPRCDSVNTKFCYYNNYSLSQPRYFCKACRRYWTQGGTLRNVPVGGGCRKNKRSKASSSSSMGGEMERTQPLISAHPSQNLTSVAGGISGNSGISPGTQSVRALPSMSSFYSGGEFLSTLAAMQSLNQQPRITQLPVNLGGGHHFGGGVNMALLQGLNLPAGQIQPQNETFPSQQYVVPPRPLGSWTQNFINNATPSASNPNFWNNATTGSTTNSSGMGSSINPNQWPDNLPGYNPS